MLLERWPGLIQMPGNEEVHLAQQGPTNCGFIIATNPARQEVKFIQTRTDERYDIDAY